MAVDRAPLLHVGATHHLPASALVVGSAARAVEQRPDHPTGHRLYAYALASAGRHAEAFEAFLVGLRTEPSRQRSGVEEVMRAEAGLLGAVLSAQVPALQAEVEDKLRRLGVMLPQGPSTSFVLTWETDVNDVEPPRDRRRRRARVVPEPDAVVGRRTRPRRHQRLRPGDVHARRPPRAYPYTIEAHYLGQGPMGYGMGTLQVIEHDGKGRLRIDERPFVIMNAGASCCSGSHDDQREEHPRTAVRTTPERREAAHAESLLPRRSLARTLGAACADKPALHEATATGPSSTRETAGSTTPSAWRCHSSPARSTRPSLELMLGREPTSRGLQSSAGRGPVKTAAAPGAARPRRRGRCPSADGLASRR